MHSLVNSILTKQYIMILCKPAWKELSLVKNLV